MDDHPDSIRNLVLAARKRMPTASPEEIWRTLGADNPGRRLAWDYVRALLKEADALARYYAEHPGRRPYLTPRGFRQLGRWLNERGAADD